MNEKGKNKTKCFSNRSTIFFSLVFIAVVSVPIIVLHVQRIFSVREVKIGILNINNEEEILEKIALDAVEIFNEQARHVKVSLYSRNNTEEELAAVFSRLHEVGVRVFLVDGDVSGVRAELGPERTDDCIFLTMSPVTADPPMNLLSLQPDPATLATVFLSLVNSTGPVVTLLPVMRDEPGASLLYSAVRAEVRKFPNIGLVNPLVYSRTEYSRSDAFQVVASLGELLSSHPGADILLLTSDLLPDILAVTHLSPGLAQRRWWAVGAAGLGVRLRAGGRGRGSQDSGARVETISYLGTDSAREEKQRLKFLEAAVARSNRSMSSKSGGSLYDQWLLYRQLRELTALTSAQSSSQSQRFLSLTLDQAGHLDILPSFPWRFNSILTVNSTDVNMEELETFSLRNVSKNLDLNCNESTVEIKIPGQSFLPEISRQFSGKGDLLLPMVEEAKVFLDCGREGRYECTVSSSSSNYSTSNSSSLSPLSTCQLQHSSH